MVLSRKGNRTAVVSGALALALCSAASAEPRRNGFDHGLAKDEKQRQNGEHGGSVRER